MNGENDNNVITENVTVTLDKESSVKVNEINRYKVVLDGKLAYTDSNLVQFSLEYNEVFNEEKLKERLKGTNGILFIETNKMYNERLDKLDNSGN